MPLFKVGNFDQIGVSFNKPAKVRAVEYELDEGYRGGGKGEYKDTVKFSRSLPLGALPELSYRIELPSMDLAKSQNKWGLYLKSLSLYESFEVFIKNLINPKNEIYFTSISWDYSGVMPSVYPPKGTKDSNFIIPMRSKTTRGFIGDGINISPARIIVGSLNLIILVYECDSGVRKLGEMLGSIHDIVGNSKLSVLINAFSSCPALTTGVAIVQAVNELLDVIGKLMKMNMDDYVDLFEGSYGTDKTQTARVEKCDHESAGIELDFTVS